MRTKSRRFRVRWTTNGKPCNYVTDSEIAALEKFKSLITQGYKPSFTDRHGIVAPPSYMSDGSNQKYAGG